uniref:G_PROTEIN_RECEP_F1_2 domain-containing protein n=1 Tax=Parastrongyloides trichosuri TaxID=131310 RepID=A0A0N4ZTD7_PARTI
MVHLLVKSSPILLFIFLYCFYILLNKYRAYENPVIVTSLGKIQGKYLTLDNGDIASIFLGIPFAEPPINERRFKKPIKKEPWKEGIYKAIEQSKSCYPHFGKIEKLINNSEDCLYLNILTPEIKKYKNLPVVVWIHGGGFSVGSNSFGNIKEIAENFISKKIIFVSIQYRLGALGWLYMKENNIGNIGFWDQARALEFIYDHIQHFGGNKSNIIMLGESAGAASVNALTISPSTRHMIHKSIELSGSILAAWSNFDIKILEENSKKFINQLKCNITDTLSCIQKIKIKDILNVTEKLYKNLNTTSFGIFGPYLSGDFFSDGIIYGIKQSRGIQSLSGLTNNEAAYFKTDKDIPNEAMNIIHPEMPLENCNNDLLMYRPIKEYVEDITLSTWIQGPISMVVIIIGLIGNLHSIRVVFKSTINTSTTISLIALALWDVLLLVVSLLHHNLYTFILWLDEFFNNKSKVQNWIFYNLSYNPYFMACILNGLLACTHMASTWMLIYVTAQRFFAVSRPLSFLSNDSSLSKKRRRASYVKSSITKIKIPCLLSIICGIISLPCSFEYYIVECMGSNGYINKIVKPSALFENRKYIIFYRSILLPILQSLGPITIISILTFKTISNLKIMMRRRALILLQQGRNSIFFSDKDKTKSLQLISALLLGKFILLRCFPTFLEIVKLIHGQKFLLTDVADLLIIFNSATNCFVFVVVKAAFETRRLKKARDRQRQMVANAAVQMLRISRFIASDKSLLLNDDGEERHTMENNFT